MPTKDQSTGAIILLGCLSGLAVYFWLVFLSAWSDFIIKLTAFVIIACILGIGAWIGWTLATTLPPQPLEEMITVVSKKENEQK
jgi:predicted DNA-binding transcriptional regulator